MYFVDREKIEQTLDFLEKEIALFLKVSELKDSFQKAVLERSVHMMIDAVLDVGNAIIDGFIMRDPGSYDDIIDILLDEKVISNRSAENFKSVIPFRKDLVQNYLHIDHQRIYDGMNIALPSFQQFPENVRHYLENELGPVSAFKK
ncbi:type VII toxin-antitoxin system HepT family RNase toxin [Fervidibacillus halotolerans]|uniref:DUF86 domain-containing protein n=1 Tax=Fervidibacillus halotolerans TaxID=2980027 RepID=A0A9E8RXL5_9BACI|nr:DUF86 domain-containing protein [Fervidibacillus halotolerans]WAA11896.1 DUF86 domain-containing protein [Fervidibacillus halotolerans]